MSRPRFIYVVAIFIFSLIFIVIVNSTYPSSSSIMFIKLDFKEPFFSLTFLANFSDKKLALTLYKTTIRKKFSITLSLTLFFLYFDLYAYLIYIYVCIYKFITPLPNNYYLTPPYVYIIHTHTYIYIY